MSRQLSAASSSRITRASLRQGPPVRQLQMEIDADGSATSSDVESLPASRRSPSPSPSEWTETTSEEDSDLDNDEREIRASELSSDDDSDEEADPELMDIVSSGHDTSIDSDEPLSTAYVAAVQRKIALNAPGTPAFKWEDQDNFVRRHGFTGTPGLQVGHLGVDSTPKECFDLFFTPTLWYQIALETNKYANRKYDLRPPSAASHMKPWTDVDVDELQRFLGIRLLMGLHPLPAYRDFWSNWHLKGDPTIKATMTRDRFEKIQSNLHFTDNEDDRAKNDKLWKIRPVVDVFSAEFKKVYIPSKDISIDESLFRFRGKHFSLQYNRNKAARWGYKCYKLCCSTGPAAGYTVAMKLYMCDDKGKVPASFKAVTNLLDVASVNDKGYDLYVDNWYTSPTLFHYLQGRKTNACGTVRKDRKWMAKDLNLTKKSKKGEFVRRSSGTGQLALQWRDRNVVTMLSTFHQGNEWTQLEPNHRGEVRSKPQAVMDYNRCMGGVDLSDQMACTYRIVRKVRKWYQNLFYHLVDTAVVNAFLVHKTLGGSMDHSTFRFTLTEALLETGRPAPRRRVQTPPVPASLTPPDSPAPARIPDGHMLQRVAKYRRCRYCSTVRKIRKETKFECSVCKVALCAGTCFNVYQH